MFTKTPSEKVQNYTAVGFEKSHLPADLYQRIVDFYHNNRANHVEEFVEGDFINVKKGQTGTEQLA